MHDPWKSALSPVFLWKAYTVGAAKYDTFCLFIVIAIALCEIPNKDPLEWKNVTTKYG